MAELKISTQPIAEKKSSYRKWIEAEGMALMEGFFIEDIKDVPLQPWERTGGLGVRICLEGTGETDDCYICEIPPGKSLMPQRHLFEEMVYVVSGRGATTIWNEGGPKRTFEWQEGSLFSPPLNTWHQHFNGSGDQPARYVAVTTAPIMINLIHNLDFIFNCNYVFHDRYNSQDDYFNSEGTWYANRVWETNFVPDVRNLNLIEWKERGAGGSQVRFQISENTLCGHVSQFPVGTYKKAHYHGPGAHVIVLSGKGYSLMWPQGGEIQRFDWGPGSMIVPPANWFHQHFNASAEPARYLALRWGSKKYYGMMGEGMGLSDVDVKLGGHQIEYEDEAPIVGQMFAEACAQAGIQSQMDKYYKPPKRSHDHETSRLAATGNKEYVRNTIRGMHSMETEVFDDLRQFIEAAKQMSDWKEIKGADWDLQIGTLIEAAAELIPQPPMLIFDDIKGYPSGYRILSLPYANYRRVALALGLPYDKSKLELVRLASRKIRSAQAIPPKEVSRAPVAENVMTGAQVNLLKFPVLRSHESDGGRYIGTGDVIINADPDSHFINMGTYRMQVHNPDLLGVWMSPGQQGRQICIKYWEKGQSCPVVAAFGQDPLTFLASMTKFPWQKSELDVVGGLRGKPLEILKGPVTGLPIPAHAEIAIEGYIPPPNEEAHDEGPFGEWTGYYSGGTIGTGEPQPVVKVKAIYHRDNPILDDEAPLWPGAVRFDLNLRAGLLWDQMENAGIQDIVGVYGLSNYLYAVAIRQRYAGHARQAAHAVLACSAAARHGRYIVVVDEDIDPTNLKEVLWAMMTRVDPNTDIETIDGCWSTPLDPRMPPEKRAARDHSNSRAIFYAVRPFAWRDKFPKVSRASRELFEQVVNEYRNVLPFPPR